jgi:hypothetical protein
VAKAFFVISCLPCSGTGGCKHRQVAVHPPRERRLGFAAVPEGRACQANERLVRQSTELADLRLLCDDLRAEVAAAWAEAALARTEAQQRQLELGQAIDERDQYWNQAAQAAGWVEALEGQLAKVSARARALAVDLAMAIGSAQSAQVVASRERAWTEGMSCLLRDFNSASLFNSCLKNFDRLSADLEKALNESAKAHARAAEQNKADRVAMPEAISGFCRAFDLDNVPSGSSPQSHLRALGGHVRSRLRGALHHGVRRAFAVLASHYDVDLERVSEGYCLPDDGEAALAEVQRLDAAVEGPSAVLASSFKVEILLPVSSSEAGPDLAEGGNGAEGAAASPVEA